MKTKFPKEIYVRIEKDSNDDKTEYLVATKTLDGEHGESVGIYKLVEIKKIKITTELE